jgi:hypothetical protein
MMERSSIPSAEDAAGHSMLLDSQHLGLSVNLIPAGSTTAHQKKNIFKPIKGDLSKRQKNLIEDSLEIEQEDARKIGAMGYMTRMLVQATLPHKDPRLPLGQLYSRNTGKLLMTVAPTSPKHGIPYGSIPRLIIAWLCTEVVLNKDRILLDRTISLGNTQSDFLKKLQMHNNGNDIRRFKDQCLRLFKSVISVEYTADGHGDLSKRLLISDQSDVFWHPIKANQRSLWESSLELSEGFCKEVIDAPVPIDMRVYHSLRKSPMSMDIYAWLTYRMFVLRRSGKPFILIPWMGLKAQIGAGYGNDRQGLYDFKANFIERLREVLAFYPAARDAVQDEKKSECLKLTPCALHIAHRKATPMFK